MSCCPGAQIAVLTDPSANYWDSNFYLKSRTEMYWLHFSEITYKDAFSAQQNLLLGSATAEAVDWWRGGVRRPSPLELPGPY